MNDTPHRRPGPPSTFDEDRAFALAGEARVWHSLREIDRVTHLVPSRQTVHKWLRGEHGPELAALLAVARFVGAWEALRVAILLREARAIVLYEHDYQADPQPTKLAADLAPVYVGLRDILDAEDRAEALAECRRLADRGDAGLLDFYAGMLRSLKAQVSEDPPPAITDDDRADLRALALAAMSDAEKAIAVRVRLGQLSEREGFELMRAERQRKRAEALGE